MATPAYVYPTAPTAIAAVASEQLYTALQYAQDNPQLRRQLMQRHNMQKNFYAMLKEMGLGSSVAGPTFAHYEEDWIINNFLVGSVITDSGGAGQNVVLALAAASMYTQTVDGITTSFSYPAVNDIVKHPNGTEFTIIAKDITTVPTAHRITLRPRLSTTVATGYFVAASRYWITTNSFGEGTYGATPKVPLTYRFTGNTQIIKSAAVETGSSMTDKVPVINMDGAEGSFGKIIAIPATEKLQMDRISKALLFGMQGDGNVTVTSDATGSTVVNRTTQGLDDFITKRGTLYPFTAGSMTIDDIDGFGTIFNRERTGSKDILALVSYGLHTQLENTLKIYMNNTCFQYAKNNAAFKSDVFDGYANQEDFFLWLGFSGFHKAGFNYLLRNVPELDEVMGAGTPGYTWQNQGWIVPIELFKNKDPQAGPSAMLPMCGYRYKELAGYNREWEVGYTGGAGNMAKTSSLDASALDIRSDIGGEWGLGNHMIKIVGS